MKLGGLPNQPLFHIIARPVPFLLGASQADRLFGFTGHFNLNFRVVGNGDLYH